MRILLALIGYLATATVIATSLGIGYLWNSGQLDDEKVFKIVALVHDVELTRDVISEDTSNAAESDSAKEEPSTTEVDRLVEIKMLDFDARQNSLDNGRSEFGYMLRQLSEARDRFDKLAQEFDQRIRLESELAGQENVTAIVRDLSKVKPDTAKDLLLRVLDEGTDAESKRAAMNDVVRLMNAMPSNTLAAILKKFTTEDDKAKLHAIHREMLAGGPKQKLINEALQQLQERNAQESPRLD
jgi:hypothetical protein